MRDLGVALLAGFMFRVIWYYEWLRTVEAALFGVVLALVVKWAERHYREELE